MNGSLNSAAAELSGPSRWDFGVGLRVSRQEIDDLERAGADGFLRSLAPASIISFGEDGEW